MGENRPPQIFRQQEVKEGAKRRSEEGERESEGIDEENRHGIEGVKRKNQEERKEERCCLS